MPRQTLLDFMKGRDEILVLEEGEPFLERELQAFAHREWLAGILCGFAYQGLVCWKKRLGDAMTAHAITNFLLALWVVGRGAWKFW